MDIGQRIKRIRTMKGISQIHICSALGRSPAWLSNIETGRRSISTYELEKIADVMGIDIAVFFAKPLHATCNITGTAGGE